MQQTLTVAQLHAGDAIVSSCKSELLSEPKRKRAPLCTLHSAPMAGLASSPGEAETLGQAATLFPLSLSCGRGLRAPELRWKGAPEEEL